MLPTIERLNHATDSRIAKADEHRPGEGPVLVRGGDSQTNASGLSRRAIYEAEAIIKRAGRMRSSSLLRSENVAALAGHRLVLRASALRPEPFEVLGHRVDSRVSLEMFGSPDTRRPHVLPSPA